MASQNLTIKLGVTGLGTVSGALRSITGAAGSAVTALGRVAVPLLALAGAGAGVAGAVGGIRSIIDEGGRLNDLGLRTSVSIRSLVRFSQVFAEAGSNAEAVGPAFDKTAKAIYAAATAGGAGELALAKLGLSAKELSGLTREAQFESLATAINAVENPTERAALAMQLLGRSGAELLPVFDAMRDLGATDQALGRLPAVLARNVRTLDAIGDSFTQAKLKSQQFFAGILDQAGTPLADLVAAATKIDLTEAGQNVGAFVQAAIEEWKQGRFGEFVSLSIEAAFEQAGNFARRTFRSLVDFLSGSSFWKGVGVGLLTAINESLKAVGSAALGLTELLANALLDSVAPFELAFVLVFNVIGQQLNRLSNEVLALANKLPPGLNPLSGVAEFKFSPLTTGATEGARGLVGSQVEAARGRLDGFLDKSTNAARDLAGYTPGTGETLDASNRLAAIVQEIRDARDKTGETETAITAKVSAQVPIVSALAAVREREAQTLRVLRSLEDARFKLNADFGVTEAQKFQQNLSLLRAQRAELERMVALLREQAALPGLSDSDRTQISQRADSFDTRLSGVDREIASVGPDPNSTPQQMMAAITELQNEFGTVAQGIARSFKDVIGTAVGSVSNGLQKLIGDTEFWSARLGNIAGPIMGAVTASISRMFTEWIVQRALAAAKNIAFSAEEGSADAAAKAPGALLTSISSFGIAAGVGLAAFLAATALTGGFRSGGYTGNGSPDRVAGVVHGGEFVMTAPTVQRLGVANLEAIQRGEPVAAAGGGGANITLATFDNRPDARKYLASAEGEAVLVDVNRRTTSRFTR